MGAAFLNDDFLLSGETARVLFHEVAEHAPIVDLHNHLSPADIADDRVYETLADLWLEDDHYKWRAMRLAGVDERVVTGDADPWEKFSAWAATVPRLIRNPLYVWSHLELRRVFGIDLPLDPSTAREIWEEANRQLPRLSAQALLAHFDVGAVATTDDPGDELDAHRRAAGNRTAMIPTFRPDGAHRLLGDPPAWNAWVDRLEAATETAVEDLASLLDALTLSHRRFAELGARASDHGLEFLPDVARDPSLADAAVRRARLGGAATAEERRSGRARGRRTRGGARCCRRVGAAAASRADPRRVAAAARTGRTRRRRRRRRRRATGARAHTAPRGARAARHPAPHRPLQRQPRGQRAVRKHRGRLLAGRSGVARAVGTALVVQRSRAGDAPPAGRPLRDRAARRFHRHAHRLALDPVDDASRALPARALRRDRTRRGRGPDPGGPRPVVDRGARHLRRQRRALLLASGRVGRRP